MIITGCLYHTQHHNNNINLLPKLTDSQNNIFGHFIQAYPVKRRGKGANAQGPLSPAGDWLTYKMVSSGLVGV